MSKIIACVGLSGVGKSTFLRKIANDCSFLHLSASDVLKAEFGRLKLPPPSSEDLRLGKVADNQKLLVDGFNRLTDSYNGIVVFDAHVLIDGINGLVEIPSWVFQNINTQHMLFLSAPPSDILSRRLNDESRVRPLRTVEQIDAHQSQAVDHARNICAEIGADFTNITIEESDYVLKLFSFFEKNTAN